MNILGGIFLDKILSNSQNDREEQALKKRRKDHDDLVTLRALFETLDQTGDISLGQWVEKNDIYKFFHIPSFSFHLHAWIQYKVETNWK